MTSPTPQRRPGRRIIGQRGQVAPVRTRRSPVGERLRDARELRGVDIFRVERDTKIRSKYVAALEDGDYTDLPGDVYTRGFLRNYATYLGLDADDIEEEWREEAGEAEPVRPLIVGPRPLTVRRKVVLQQSHLVIGVVAVIVLVVAGYFGFQVSRYLSYPVLAVASAGPSPITVRTGTTTYVMNGTATAGATILISWNGQDLKPIFADDLGNWTYTAALQAGSNQFDITAKNLDTSHASQTTRLIVIVPSPTPTPVVPEVAFDTPADGAAVPSGSVTVSGTSTLVSSVTLSMTYLGGPQAAGSTLPPSPGTSAFPSPSPSDSAEPSGTPGPAPVLAQTGADGTFSFTLSIAPGRWQLTIVGATANGAQTKPVSRALNVTYKGFNVTIQVTGGQAQVYVAHDGVVDANAGVADGWSITVVGNKYVCVNSQYRARYVLVTINGAPPVPISSFGGWHVWVDSKGARNTDSC